MAQQLKKSACNAEDPGDVGLIPGSGRSPGEGNGNPLQYSCLGNPRDRGAWQATVHGVTQSQTQLSMHAFTKELQANVTTTFCWLVAGHDS